MNAYRFNISLSILNHLGRNLYRSFVTVLGEAISNAWDADATNVVIDIDREKNVFVIKDDGYGMTDEDFQNKFLTIGYSKRSNNISTTPLGRPFIGRKGIGKLALLSCAKSITVLTKTQKTELVGGVIDNSSLDEAIRDDVKANEYQLDMPSPEIIERYAKDFNNGTIIIFENLNEGIRNKIEYIRKQIALYFRFALLDDSFRITLNNKLIDLEELRELIDNTQLLWEINNPQDPYISDYLKKQEALKCQENLNVKKIPIAGFIASVTSPSMLKIRGSEEKVTLDLYVNGRIREKDILKHMPTARIAESYLYGQIHYNALDDEQDRFTSSREGVVSDDPKFKEFLLELEKIIKYIVNKWDEWRVSIKQDGDVENTRIPPKDRKSKELFNVISKDFVPVGSSTPIKKKVEGWINELHEDASFNFSSYGECFIAENLLRRYAIENSLELSEKYKEKVQEYRSKANRFKEIANISFEIRENNHDLSYFAMDELAYIAEPDKEDFRKSSLYRDAQEYKPIRDAMAHTSRLTQTAKNRLNATYENIKARIIFLLGKS